MSSQATMDKSAHRIGDEKFNKTMREQEYSMNNNLQLIWYREENETVVSSRVSPSAVVF